MKKIYLLLLCNLVTSCFAVNYSDDPDYHDSRSLGFTNEVPPLGHEPEERELRHNPKLNRYAINW